MKKSSQKKSSSHSRWLIPVLPPLITGILGIVSTLLVTGHLLPLPKNGTAAAASTTTATPTVLNAPYVYFSAKPVETSLPDCMAKANAGLRAVSVYPELRNGHPVAR